MGADDTKLVGTITAAVRENDARLEEIKIATEMESAGFEALYFFDSDLGDARETAIKVYSAMEVARRSAAAVSLSQHLACAPISRGQS